MREKYICCFGEAIWDDFSPAHTPGGRQIGLAVGLQNLGFPAVMITCVGNDELGQKIKDFLQSKNCTTRAIQTDLRYGTGIVRTRISPSGERYSEMVQPAAWDNIKYLPPVANLVKSAYAFVFNTLSCRQKNNLDTLLQLLAEAPLKVYDVNLSPYYYNQSLVDLLLNKADIVKINDAELKVIADWHRLGSLTENEQLQMLYKKFNLKKIILTKETSGVTCLDDGVFYYSKGYKPQGQGSTPGNDIFLAGFLTNLYLKQPTGKALQFACALDSITTTYQPANKLAFQAE